MTLTVQFMTIFAMVLSGFYLGIIQETFRRFTVYWRKRIFLTYFLEISFWLTQTVIIFYVLFRVNAGEIRLYVFLACLLGFSVYQVFAKSVYKKLLEIIIRMAAAVYRFFERLFHGLIITPISWILKLIMTIILSIVQLVVAIILFILKLVFTPFKWIGIGIYRLLPGGFKKILHKLAGFYSKMKNITYKGLKKLLFKRR